MVRQIANAATNNGQAQSRRNTAEIQGIRRLSVENAPHPRSACLVFLAGIRAGENAASPSRATDIVRSGQMRAGQIMTRTH